RLPADPALFTGRPSAGGPVLRRTDEGGTVAGRPGQALLHAAPETADTKDQVGTGWTVVRRGHEPGQQDSPRHAPRDAGLSVAAEPDADVGQAGHDGEHPADGGSPPRPGVKEGADGERP